MWSQSPLSPPPTPSFFFPPGPCVISGQASDYSCDYCAAVCLRSVEAPRVLPARLCAGSQPVRQLSRSDLWPLDSNLSSLPARYCCNWQLMRPDMLSSRALNRTSIFPRHWALVFFFVFFCTLPHTVSVFFSEPSLLSIYFSAAEYLTASEKACWRRCFSEGEGGGKASFPLTRTHSNVGNGNHLMPNLI